MADLRGRVENIAALARAVDSDYSHLYFVLKGEKAGEAVHPGVELATAIEQATGGAIRAWELLGLPDGPPPVIPSSKSAA